MYVYIYIYWLVVIYGRFNLYTYMYKYIVGAIQIYPSEMIDLSQLVKYGLVQGEMMNMMGK